MKDILPTRSESEIALLGHARQTCKTFVRNRFLRIQMLLQMKSASVVFADFPSLYISPFHVCLVWGQLDRVLTTCIESATMCNLRNVIGGHHFRMCDRVSGISGQFLKRIPTKPLGISQPAVVQSRLVDLIRVVTKARFHPTEKRRLWFLALCPYFVPQSVEIRPLDAIAIQSFQNIGDETIDRRFAKLFDGTNEIGAPKYRNEAALLSWDRSDTSAV